MTALTPACDPDLSLGGAPFGPVPTRGPRVRSGLVLLAVVAVAALLVVTSAPLAATVPAVAVGGLCAVALVRRGLRIARRAAPAR